MDRRQETDLIFANPLPTEEGDEYHRVRYLGAPPQAGDVVTLDDAPWEVRALGWVIERKKSPLSPQPERVICQVYIECLDVELLCDKT